MGFATTHKKGSVFSFNSEGLPFKSLNDLELGKEYEVKAAYILSKRGKMRQDMPNIVTADAVINIPSHMLDDVRDLISNEDAIAQVEAGKLYFKPYEYTNSEGTFRSIEWIDK